ncbi:hypothetical protein NPIL_436991 [Nephila pilipes]|uniref:Uncharacterized protein n=1 Tax=Nephila pilipes TaxID=299642 RepID=A0A8X6R1Y3_NEPPI|nr:hypothetical protein NPIL_436991 [Nephila pilipes]
MKIPLHCRNSYHTRTLSNTPASNCTAYIKSGGHHQEVQLKWGRRWVRHLSPSAFVERFRGASRSGWGRPDKSLNDAVHAWRHPHLHGFAFQLYGSIDLRAAPIG